VTGTHRQSLVARAKRPGESSWSSLPEVNQAPVRIEAFYNQIIKLCRNLHRRHQLAGARKIVVLCGSRP
jgi:hypothetical protein